MRFVLGVLAVLAAASTSPAQTATMSAGVAHTTTALRLHVAPAGDAATLALIPSGGAVTVGACDGGWCSVKFRHFDGYAAERYLSNDPRATVPASRRGYINSRGIWVPSPTRTPNGTPPSGASAQCADGSYSFSMSRRGTCSHHGGVARWL